MRDTGRALLVGTRTYGKGSVQTVYENRDGSALKLTIGRYYTPSGEPIVDLQGIEPELNIPWPAEAPPHQVLTQAISEVPGLSATDRAHLLTLTLDLESPSAETSARIPWQLDVQERLALDPQLQAALEAF
jgi:C-terminal processing protease CtpA/Prc